MNYFKTIVRENVKVCDGIYALKVTHNTEIKAGQFYMLKPKTALLGRPISVCEVEGEIVTFLYAVVGKGTEEFKHLMEGDSIELIGPLGNGFDVEKDYGKVALVGGGIGVAPLLQLSKVLREKNKDAIIDFYGGYREETYLDKEIAKYVNEIKLSTNSGNIGHKGFITEILDLDKYDTVLCCGPEVMMEKVVQMCKNKNVNVYVSMEKHMACGVGACLVCTCKTKYGNKRTCKDGPVFNGLEIEF
ncbi:dihydroorotate dehydrogenase electron transfer subunit [Clostridium tarantellae]|uniref:Dihydroorotate dehydrogenase B (NAD(+)), electron transfer subunit n=1 Tax=Clostridium tarantellae TaxID=39493 RepID=A0A6I1MNT0_9CLOT|nr:dihydroorotate dehydrogenase electron transfer subunit [Clostridium tarantellae]MPQ44423.1 dihydroorotate dehydrogenase electron transfer subunit [Clostridium tarantellae]